MDRNGEPSGTPDSYHGDEGMSTKNQLWLQNQAIRQQFQRIEARLDDTFDEFLGLFLGFCLNKAIK